MVPKIARVLAAFVVLGAAGLAAAPSALASDPSTIVASGAYHRTISMGAGKAVIVTLPRDATEVFVGDPKVANAVVRSARKIYLVGVGAGQTTIFANDAAGRQIATIDVNIGRDVGSLQELLAVALPGSAIRARTVADTIILTGEARSAADVQKAMDIAQGYAKMTLNSKGVNAPTQVVNSVAIRGQDQVTLKVVVAEVQRDVLKQFGVSLTGGGNGVFQIANAFSLNGTLGNASVQLGSTVGPGGASSPVGLLQAFEREGVARVLAEPTVTAISGEQAKFTAGGEVPYSAGNTCTGTGASASCNATVSYKNYGVTLNFTPLVLSSGRVQLHVATEVSDIDTSRSFTIGGSAVPAFVTRKNETTVELPSGGSIVSAGLIQEKSAQAINGFPGLMNLPVLGALFRSRDFQRHESELMIVVTPYLVHAVAQSDLPRPDQGFRDATDPQTILLGRVNQLYSTRSNPQIVDALRGRFGFVNE
ncbi:MAG: type II and III secretion system protein family protein [Hyphomicrobiales bacterium]|nr:type II and III secretion system protein family protein [Hyphomicrobiales bacterium]